MNITLHNCDASRGKETCNCSHWCRIEQVPVSVVGQPAPESCWSSLELPPPFAPAKAQLRRQRRILLQTSPVPWPCFIYRPKRACSLIERNLGHSDHHVADPLPPSRGPRDCSVRHRHQSFPITNKPSLTCLIFSRHRNAVVVRDPASHRLEIRGSTCPTCHQALPQPADHPYDRSYDVEDDSYMDPDYFRMLRRGNHGFPSPRGPPSPVRVLPRPAFDSSSHRPSPEVIDEEDDAETPQAFEDRPRRGSRIRREAFSPKYFQTFFVEERVLGKGGKGEVLLVRHQIDGCHLGYFACKRVPVGDDHAWLEKVLVEVELLAKLSHPNLVSYRHVWLEDVRLTLFGPSVVCAFILQQFCNSGDLQTYVVGNAPATTTKEQLKAQMRRRSKGQPETPTSVNKSRLTFEEIYSIFKDITSGVAYLHASDYIHRDLKPGNCLLHRQGDILTCLISDFGEVQPGNKARNSTGATGTISYCAPEVLKMGPDGLYGNFTTKSDMFSLGMILYFMCFGRLPYRSANAIQEELEDIELLRAEITDWKGYKDERRERPDLPSKLYKLLNRLLSLDPNERPSANEVLNAMKSETNFDGLTRAESFPSPNIGLGSSRIQNLDSPANSGTPEPGKCICDLRHAPRLRNG